MGAHGEFTPRGVRSSAEYVALLRRLKEESGLTFRQLEERAAERGEVLARSTLAQALRQDTLPRAEVVVAFLRACGEDRDLGVWLEIWSRIGVDRPPNGAVEPRPRSAPALRGRSVIAAAMALALVTVAVAAYLLGRAGAETRRTDAQDGSTPRGTPGPTRQECRGEECKGRHPEPYGCFRDMRKLGSVDHQSGKLELFRSPSCQAIWAQAVHPRRTKVVAAYVRTDGGGTLYMAGDELLKDSVDPAGTLYTSMLPQKVPSYAKVCFTYETFEVCVDSDGDSLVKPMPMPSPSASRGL
ncbi:helix-turn-helix domain-containing protein [Streptomyces jumonjinensis]|uniref:DUF2690 domain-containing protein n=1 Tax=Streptomyces jumonjinensis TaxID=1945 RepID=A0A646KMM0_STRJU|nr:helix-turn-helix transcriptional regulator [Streptomyces jumonjinensis]MQT03330.1 DUF2690 domain-containing protein [Streptomyces jumonjinensis]